MQQCNARMHTHDVHWNRIIHPCRNFKGGLAKQLGTWLSDCILSFYVDLKRIYTPYSILILLIFFTPVPQLLPKRIRILYAYKYFCTYVYKTVDLSLLYYSHLKSPSFLVLKYCLGATLIQSTGLFGEPLNAVWYPLNKLTWICGSGSQSGIHIASSVDMDCYPVNDAYIFMDRS